MVKLLGKDTSLWIDTTDATDYPKLLEANSVFDVAVVGGGISGILTAWMLQKEGLKTAVIEKDRIVENTTGNTTAKLTSQHNLVYKFLIDKHGRDVAKAFGELNQQAIEDIDGVARSLEIDCDFGRKDAFVYTQKADKAKEIEAEVEAAKSLGLPANLENQIDLPVEIKAAIKFSDQAQFHPRKFLLGVAEDYLKAGGIIFENSEARDIEPGNPNKVRLHGKALLAKQVVVASKYPMWRKELFEKTTWVKLSYALGVLLANDDYPSGMYISSEEPVRTIRAHPYEGGQILIYGGESHKMTKDYNKDEHYQTLIDDVQKEYKVKEIVYRWIAGDMMPHDRLPYIGLYPGEKSIYVITGFHAWGLTQGMYAAEMITDQIIGKQNPFAEIFSPKRLET